MIQPGGQSSVLELVIRGVSNTYSNDVYPKVSSEKLLERFPRLKGASLAVCLLACVVPTHPAASGADRSVEGGIGGRPV